MDAKVQSFLDKIKVMADKTSQAAAARRTPQAKRRPSWRVRRASTWQIFDLNTECEVLYKEIGKMVYDLHCGAEVSNDEMDEKIAAIDAKQEKIGSPARGARPACGRSWSCPHCGKTCSREDAFCSGCGGAL